MLTARLRQTVSRTTGFREFGRGTFYLSNTAQKAIQGMKQGDKNVLRASTTAKFFYLRSR